MNTNKWQERFYMIATLSTMVSIIYAVKIFFGEWIEHHVTIPILDKIEDLKTRFGK